MRCIFVDNEVEMLDEKSAVRSYRTKTGGKVCSPGQQVSGSQQA